ncbi:tungstate transport system substrate-binding protein [Halalkaliarchaeum desulfuricum]|uniref:Tungstate transport system substrate-binding protein n=1 Tax=Halalkaliarchaeum desulfuricum TaxID=2055893 RepID=A0A343TGY1_9EURY|nr:substrate-binding domain-containing protein [Halalkaliarchaeum desulfuricum]AUX08353.1 tungstate transport system substrate-binding protein [Halalkaliarchaeum desulfuricum]
MQRREFIAAVTLGASTATAGCVTSGSEGTGGPAGLDGDTLTLTTTTSTYDTGLVDELNASFQERFGATVHAIDQGTGAALETGRNGDCDVVLVHARALEDEFLREGYGVNRRDLMYNDFVVVGPEADPAGVDGADGVIAAFEAIAGSESTFVSRGDDSGTYAREQTIWEESTAQPGGEWYREAGAGMGEVLTQAAQSGGYTLADRGTFISMRSQIELGIRLQGPIEDGPELLWNRYGIVAVNPAVHDGVAYDLAMAYIGFVTSPAGQRIIEEYTVDGERLFVPEAVSAEPNFRQYVPEGWDPEEE